MTTPQELDDLMDRLVSEYSDRVARGTDEAADDLLEQVPEIQRESLERCFRMIRSGIASAPSATQPLGPGTLMDGYRIVKEIGRGGMAVVFEAIQEDLNRSVALKVLRPGLALDTRHVDRFRREALSIARLQHPHIVQVHAVGEALGHHYLAMELVDGTNLARVIDRLPKTRSWTSADLAEASGIPALGDPELSYEQAFAKLVAPVARALGLAHELGIVHRDIKPSNILINKDGRAVLADFGLAKGDGDPGLSLSGEPLGTPFYMSPEQAAIIQHPVEQRSDVYSFGVTLYEGLTGQRPFDGKTVIAVIDAIRHRIPPSVRSIRRTLTRNADAVVRRAMAKMPEQRYATAIDLSTELAAMAEGRVTQAAALEGGPIRSAFRKMRNTFLYIGFTDYRSKWEFLGMPLVHINTGHRMPGQPVRRARGWLAIGDVASGFLAFGGAAYGVIACGGFSVGLFSVGGMALGLVTFGGLSAGALLGVGGMAMGYGALGGMAYGQYSIGGWTFGPNAAGRGGDPHPVSEAWFESLFGWIIG